MGQKIHPEGFRVGYIHDWKSTWFNEREFAPTRTFRAHSGTKAER